MSETAAPAPEHRRGQPADTASIRHLARRVAWRIGTQRGLERGLMAGGIGLACVGVLLILVQLLVITPAVVTPALVGVAAATGLAFGAGFWRRPTQIALASRIDVANGLHSDLSNALALAPPQDTDGEMADLAIARGLASAKTADWRRAAPWRGAVSGTAVAVAVGGAVVFFLAALWAPSVGLHRDARAVAPFPEPGRPEKPQGIALGEETVEALEALVPPPQPQAEDKADTTALDERVRGAVDALDALVQAVLDGQLSQEEAFSQLSELEGDLAKWQDEQGSGIAEAQERVSEAARTRLEDKRQASKALSDMLEALRKKSWAEAAAAAETAATKLADGSIDKREQEKLAKSLEKLATDLKSEHAKKIEALKEEEDRLKSKEKLAPEKVTAKEKERLKELERELQSLEREEKEVSEAMRELAKLAREYEDLARELMKRFKFKGGSGDSGEGGGQGEKKPGGSGIESGSEGAGSGPEESLRRAAEMIRKLGAGEASSEEAQKALERIERMRDALKKGGQNGEGQEMAQGGPGGQQPGGDQQPGAEGQGQGGQRMQLGGEGANENGGPNQGENGQRDATLAMSDPEGASPEGGQMPGGKPGQAGGKEGQNGQGQPGQPGAMSMREGAADGKEAELSMPGEGQPGGEKGGTPSPMDGKGQGESASLGNGKAPGQGQPKIGTKGVGQGHDANLLGEKTDAEGKAKAEFVPGAQGEGQSTSNIVEVAAQKGFATAGYEEVLQDYRNVAEDALRRELIPAGKRGYVRRYFDLIKPR